MDICITTDYIRLDSLLKLAGAAGTGGTAKHMIQAGQVSVNGEVCCARGKKLVPGNVVDCGGQSYRVSAC